MNMHTVCHKLDEYGCNPTSIPELVRLYVNNKINDYTLPTDPCLFDTINMSWIFTQIDSSILNAINGASYFETIPCQVLIQISDILISKDLQYLITEDYWFGNQELNNDKVGECDTINTNNNLYNITLCDYHSDNPTNNTTNNHTAETSNNNNDQCINDDKDCYYPYYRSSYKTNKLKVFGQCHCQLSCQLEFYPGQDIKQLDNYNLACCIIALFLIIGYFINWVLEFKSIKNESNNRNNNKFCNLPLTFDIPIFCSLAAFSMIICLILPYTILDKDYFSCDHRANTKIVLRAKRLPDANWSCFIQG